MFDPLRFPTSRGKIGDGDRRELGEGVHREVLNFPGDGRWSEVFYPGLARPDVSVN